MKLLLLTLLASVSHIRRHFATQLRQTFTGIFLLAALFSGSALSKEVCDSRSLNLDDGASKIQKYFYTGTCHYRNEEYTLAVDNWLKIKNLVPNNEEDPELKIAILNNLGYMMYFGFGIEMDTNTAIEYWRESAELGEDESNYHLCHAHADDTEPTFNPEVAKEYCNKALAIYSEHQQPDTQILEDIRYYLKLLDE